MIAFYILVAIAVVFVYFLAAFLYKPIGKFFGRIWDDFKEEIEYDTNKKQKGE